MVYTIIVIITYIKEIWVRRDRLMTLWRSKKCMGQCWKLRLRSKRGLVFAVIKVFMTTYTCTNSWRRRISSFVWAYLHEGNAIAVLVIHIYKRTHRTIAFRALIAAVRYTLRTGNSGYLRKNYLTFNWKIIASHKAFSHLMWIFNDVIDFKITWKTFASIRRIFISSFHSE